MTLPNYELFMRFQIGTISFFAGALLGGLTACYGMKDPVDLSRLRLSERKANVLTVEERADAFVKDVVPEFGLRRDSFQYKVLSRACLAGVYGSEKDDWAISQRKVEYTLNACGWTLPNEKK